MRLIRFIIRGIITIAVTMLILSIADAIDVKPLRALAMITGIGGAFWTLAGLAD
ncbi:MAG: hypothetical protein KIS94_06075 [Chitinophagales bacterium]|nr:hypothetical protein [Chitinophagales bacterium]